MTLVIAQKKGNDISFSSDSRISFGEYSTPFDYGIKVFSVPVKIYSPVDSQTSNKTLDYDRVLGLAICGSVINAYTVKESIYEILQNLQHIPLYQLSMDGIAKLVLNVFSSVTLALVDSLLDHKALSELILGGYCPVENKVRVFKFSSDISVHPITPCCIEILKTEDTQFFGTGKTEAENISIASKNLTPLGIIKQVIQCGKVDSVGGSLQYGVFEHDNNFKIYGVADCELVNGHPKDSFQLRGMNLYNDELEKGADGFHVSYECVTPFEKERNDIFNRILNDAQP